MSCLLYTSRGHTVYVQHTAGENSGFPDSAYETVGAKILPSINDVYQTAEMIVKVKEPIAVEYPLVRKGQLVFTYFHFASDEKLTLAMMDSGSVCLAYETVENPDGTLPLLILSLIHISSQLYRSFKGYPRNKALIKFLSEQGIKAQMLKTEEYFMSENMRHMHEATDELYFVIDEKNNSIELSDKGIDLLTGRSDDPTFFVLPDITSELSQLENFKGTEEEKQANKDEILAN